MKNLLIALILMGTLTCYGQRKHNTFALQTGLSYSAFSQGDIKYLGLHNELSYNINKRLMGSVGLGLGKAHDGIYETASFVQGDASIFFSPYQNNRKIDFRIGGGLNVLHTDITKQANPYIIDGVIQDPPTISENKVILGTHLMVDFTYGLTDRLFIGLRGYKQRYWKDASFGARFSFGVKL